MLDRRVFLKYLNPAAASDLLTTIKHQRKENWDLTRWLDYLEARAERKPEQELINALADLKL